MEDLNIDTIAKRSIKGVIALTSRTFFLNIVSLIASLVVFTELSRSDVGVYIAVTAAQRVISFFTDFGLGAALVQKKEALTESDLATSFSIQFLITSIIFVLFFLLSNAIGSFFHFGQNGQTLLLVLVFLIFLSSFKMIPSILLERNLQFHKLVIPQAAESLVYNAILITLVLSRFGIMSYAWAFIISGIVSLPIYYYVSPWKIKFRIDPNSLQHLRFGTQFQAKNILATVKDDLLTVILVKFLSYTEIGFIGFAQRLAFFSYRYIVDSVTKVTFSTYARIQEDVKLLEKAIDKSLFFVSFFMSPVLFGIIVTAPYFVMYFPKWNNKWEPAILSLLFFCLNALISSFSGILVNVLDATGRVKTTLYLMIAWTILVWILTPLGIYLWGYNGVAIASFLVTLTIFITVQLVKEFVTFHFWRSTYKPILSAIVMAILVYVLCKTFVVGLVSLGIVVLFGGILYIAFAFYLAKEELKENMQLVKGAL